MSNQRFASISAEVLQARYLHVEMPSVTPSSTASSYESALAEVSLMEPPGHVLLMALCLTIGVVLMLIGPPRASWVVRQLVRQLQAANKRLLCDALETEDGRFGRPIHDDSCSAGAPVAPLQGHPAHSPPPSLPPGAPSSTAGSSVAHADTAFPSTQLHTAPPSAASISLSACSAAKPNAQPTHALPTMLRIAPLSWEEADRQHYAEAAAKPATRPGKVRRAKRERPGQGPLVTPVATKPGNTPLTWAEADRQHFLDIAAKFGIEPAKARLTWEANQQWARKRAGVDRARVSAASGSDTDVTEGDTVVTTTTSAATVVTVVAVAAPTPSAAAAQASFGLKMTAEKQAADRSQAAGVLIDMAQRDFETGCVAV